MELGYVMAAVVAAGPATASVWFTVRNGRKIAATHDEMRTNSGKRAGEYLELISHEQDFVARQLVGATQRQYDLDAAFKRHASDDERRFDEIMRKLDER